MVRYRPFPPPIDMSAEELVEALVNDPELINAQDYYGDTLLTQACASNQVDLVAILLAQPEIDVNLKNRDGKDALILSCITGHVECVEWLITHPNIDPNTQTRHKPTLSVILTAVLSANRSEWPNYTECFQLLLDHPNIDVNIQDQDGETPLHWACQSLNSTRFECAEMLIARSDTNVNLHDNQGTTALMRCLTPEKDMLLLKLLTRDDLDINAVNNQGETALIIASREGYDTAVAMLLSMPEIDVYHRDRYGYTASMRASDPRYANIANFQKINTRLAQHIEEHPPPPNIITRVLNYVSW